MTLDILKEKGTPLDKQQFTWGELVQAPISETLGETTPGPTLEQIQDIGSEELDHFLLINDTIAGLGSDPTVESPCADVIGVASMVGIMQVLTDPRTTMAQCLSAMLTAELTDNAGWELLIELAESLGYDEMKTEFETCLQHEERHLSNVRNWVSDCVLESAHFEIYEIT